MKKVRVRFAPSPTGHLHIGGVRTALFNWLFARHHRGTFILRIEDTDLKRSKKRYLDEILDCLLWLGLKWDEGPYLQTRRLKVYRRYVQRLLDEGKAYHCYESRLTPHESKKKTPDTRRKTHDTRHETRGAIRFKVPPEKVKMNDLVHGPIEFDNSLLGDFIIQKSDGSPTYNFACVVDDYEMHITHVIRGDDHISNTPKQLALYQALDVPWPEFAHIPLIMGPDRTRLSKRHGATAITQYRKEGYLPQALVNFLALLGWSPGEDLEIIGLDEIIRRFSLSRVGRTSSIFNLEKLEWMNHQYIKRIDLDGLTDLLIPFLRAKGYIGARDDREFCKRVVEVFGDRTKKLADFTGLTSFIFQNRITFSRAAKERLLNNPQTPRIFGTLVERLSPMDAFDAASVEKSCRALIGDLGIPSGELIHPARAALTGRTVSAGLFEVMSLLGKERVIGRLDRATKLIEGWRKQAIIGKDK